MTGFAHDIRDAAARAISVATVSEDGAVSSPSQVAIKTSSEPAPILVRPEGELSGSPEAEQG